MESNRLNRHQRSGRRRHRRHRRCRLRYRHLCRRRRHLRRPRRHRHYRRQVNKFFICRRLFIRCMPQKFVVVKDLKITLPFLLPQKPRLYKKGGKRKEKGQKERQKEKKLAYEIFAVL